MYDHDEICGESMYVQCCWDVSSIKGQYKLQPSSSLGREPFQLKTAHHLLHS